MSRIARLATFMVVFVAWGTMPVAAQEQAPWPPVATFSIVGFDPATGEVGVAVQSRVFSVGNGVIWGEAGVGVVATQAIVDVSYGPQGLQLLREGYSPADAVKEILARDPDPDPERWSREGRQFSIMNARGEVATHTGERASEWAGYRIGEYCSAQGNILAGPAVVDDMVEAFETTGGTPLPEVAGGAGSRTGSRRRHPGHAVGRDADREGGRGRLAQQRCRASVAGGRRPRAHRGAAAAGGDRGGPDRAAPSSCPFSVIGGAQRREGFGVCWVGKAV